MRERELIQAYIWQYTRVLYLSNWFLSNSTRFTLEKLSNTSNFQSVHNCVYPTLNTVN